MLSWAQRTARWTVKTLPFSFGRAADGDVTASTSAGQCPPRPEDRGSRHHPMHQRGSAAPVRGRHAAPSRSRRARERNAG